MPALFLVLPTCGQGHRMLNAVHIVSMYSCLLGPVLGATLPVEACCWVRVVLKLGTGWWNTFSVLSAFFLLHRVILWLSQVGDLLLWHCLWYWACMVVCGGMLAFMLSQWGLLVAAYSGCCVVWCRTPATAVSTQPAGTKSTSPSNCMGMQRSAG